MRQLTLTAVGQDLGESVELVDRPDPVLAGDDLLVAVEAAPINNADMLFAAGWFAVQPSVPSELGAEGVGRVVQVGPAADPELVGRRVLILPTFEHGTWTDHAVVPARSVIPVSDRGDALQLAMLPVNPATAYALLNDFVSLKPGDWIGLNLANSAVGQYVITLAGLAGVKTLAVVRREEAAEQVRQLGADLVLVEGENLGDRVKQALGGNQLRLLLDGTGDSSQVSELVGAVEAGGSVVVFAAVSGQSPALPLPDLIYRGISLRSFFVLNWIRAASRQRLEKVYAELAELAEKGTISAAVEATYPLEEFRTALEHAGRTGRTGKILFTPGRPTA
ncbi:zinc-dependent alcohol dehydrogenase family protein [Actinacidiphila acididurans]|uniref:enoyl-[acyl-carrier-protein] reductase n=1 Tax=Actinacidiphila acididurans TaxID=2784346 RepID=A0ABS2TX42_9ACTN|nr:zinc-dependent alcohol dehydrogenase family protein [Actinacidiphila acididurans]MBM9507917.1 zinc-dependent alcohol dehydrogenase family protein [Actinacidiphila acididurans]